MRALLPIVFLCMAVGPAHAAEPVPGEGAKEEAAPARMELEEYQLVLLVRPEDPPELPEEEAASLQAAHTGHLRKMAEEGHLVAAGPFGDQDDSRMRGLALYRVGSVEEVRRLAEQDPAVEAGRLGEGGGGISFAVALRSTTKVTERHPKRGHRTC